MKIGTSSNSTNKLALQKNTKLQITKIISQSIDNIYNKNKEMIKLIVLLK